MSYRRLRSGLVVALAALMFAGCGEEAGPMARDAGSPSESPRPAPSAVPAADGPVATRGAVMVLQTREGPVVCLGPVALSDPPQCIGQPLAGWRWAQHPEHRRSGGVRWGAFELKGTWDGRTLTVEEAVPQDEAGTSATEEPDLSTPCDEPDDGWVQEPARTGDRVLDAVLVAAGRLPDHAETWVDPANDVLNVRVTDDVARAERTLRETWGGGLCVQRAEYSEEELVALAAELQQLPGVLTSSAHADVVTVEVVYDDSSIQEWADTTYGEGRVEVRSALAPA